MFAVVEDRRQQYRVAAGDRVLIARVPGAESGQNYEFGQVCLVGGEGQARIGTPYVSGVRVTAKVVRQDVMGPKLVIQKYRRRKNFRKRTGFRARFTEIQIEAIHGA
ncbi:MAG: 50S ribosomal protein L21 [Planctomycetota bacterium]